MEGLSNYHALQASISHRLSSQLTFNFNYTWSHMLSTQDSGAQGGQSGPMPFQRAYNPAANYGSSNFDIRHMIKGYAIYTLPVGRGRQYEPGFDEQVAT